MLKCGSWALQPYTINPGLPQGSPLSPVLFNVYTLSITGECEIQGGRTLSYADDILVYSQGRDREMIAREVQSELERIEGWCVESGALVNPTKASVTWFSLNNYIVHTQTPNVTFCGEVLVRTSTMKHLGVLFDRSLWFYAHVDTIIIKARRGLAAMRVMSAAKCAQQLLFLLYQGLVLSVIEYAMAILTLSPRQTERLDKIQNEAMRIILGCTRDTEIRAMRYLLDCPTIDHRLQLCRARGYLRISGDKTHPLHLEIGRPKGCRLKRGKSWMGRAEDVIQRVCALEDIEPGEEWVQVPVDFQAFFKVIITLDRSSKNNTPVALEAEVQALVEDTFQGNDIVIYTDGSVIRHVRSSWAYTARSGGRVVQEESGAFAVTTSSMTMEIMAVSRALAWMETQIANHVCILSDSMSMISRVRTGWVRGQWLESVKRSSVQGVTFIFVPGHAGVVGNERADRLASMAVVGGGGAMDRADILHAIRDINRTEEATAGVVSTSISRMQELGVQRGVARHECFSGNRRCFINQQRTGTVSRRVLMEILKMRSEHLWTCSTCNDDDLTTN